MSVAEPPWWRSDPVWFWLFGGLFAVMSWSPLVFYSRSGLQGGDCYTYFFPLKAWYAERLQSGELPLWNPLVGNGFPALGESQTGVFYPLNLVLYGSLPLGAAYNASFVLHYVLAFAFTCHYTRRLGLSLMESLLAAVVFVYGWFPARSSLEWAIVTGAWLPLALWGVEGFVATGRRRCLMATQAAVVMQLLAGHFNFAFITLLAIVLYAMLRLFVERSTDQPMRRIAPVAVAVLLSCGLAAIQLVPSWELKGRSQRGSSDFGEQKIAYGSIPWSYFAQAIRPWEFYPRAKDSEFHNEYFGSRNTNKVEAHLYFGLVPLGLAVVGIAVSLLGASGQEKLRQPLGAWTWLVMGVVFLSLTPGWWARWANHLPGFGYFTGPGRYGIVVQLSMGVLAARGLRNIRDGMLLVGDWIGGGWTRLIAVCGIGCGAVATEYWTKWAGGIRALSMSLAPFPWGRIGGYLPFALMIAAVVAGIVIIANGSRRAATVAFGALCVLIAWADYSLVAPYVSDAEIRLESPIDSRERSVVRGILKHSWPGARVLARHQNAVSLCGVATVPIYLGIGPSEYFGGPLRIPDEFHWESAVSAAMLQWLEWSGVTHVLAFDPIVSDSLELIWAGYDPFLHELLGRPAWQPLMLYELRSARGRAYRVPLHQAREALQPEGRPSQLKPIRAIQRSASTTEIPVECDEESVVILTELNYPGWRVSVDGRPTEAFKNSVFRAVHVRAGRHVVRWVYRPLSLQIGLIVSLLCLVSTLVFFWPRRHVTPSATDGKTP